MTTEPRRFARDLRRNQTSAEDALWQQLRDRRLAGTKWRRQVTLGSYTADFLCVAAKLIVEVDGTQHAEVFHYDAMRTREKRKASRCCGSRTRKCAKGWTPCSPASPRL